MLQDAAQMTQVLRGMLQVHKQQLHDLENLVEQLDNMVTNMLYATSVLDSEEREQSIENKSWMKTEKTESPQPLQ